MSARCHIVGADPVVASGNFGKFLGRSVSNPEGEHFGQCVSLVRSVTGAPHSFAWQKGDPVRGADIPKGTAIATFDEDGTYGNHVDGRSHAAIYVSQDDSGLNVMDQWAGQPAHYRKIWFRGGSEAPHNDGDAFSVVLAGEDIMRPPIRKIEHEVLGVDSQSSLRTLDGVDIYVGMKVAVTADGIKKSLVKQAQSVFPNVSTWDQLVTFVSKKTGKDRTVFERETAEQIADIQRLPATVVRVTPPDSVEVTYESQGKKVNIVFQASDLNSYSSGSGLRTFFAYKIANAVPVWSVFAAGAIALAVGLVVRRK